LIARRDQEQCIDRKRQQEDHDLGQNGANHVAKIRS
jgi:hypothetical protein